MAVGDCQTSGQVQTLLQGTARSATTLVSVGDHREPGRTPRRTGRTTSGSRARSAERTLTATFPTINLNFPLIVGSQRRQRDSHRRRRASRTSLRWLEDAHDAHPSTRRGGRGRHRLRPDGHDDVRPRRTDRRPGQRVHAEARTPEGHRPRHAGGCRHLGRQPAGDVRSRPAARRRTPAARRARRTKPSRTRRPTWPAARHAQRATTFATELDRLLGDQRRGRLRPPDAGRRRQVDATLNKNQLSLISPPKHVDYGFAEVIGVERHRRAGRVDRRDPVAEAVARCRSTPSPAATTARRRCSSRTTAIRRT